MPEIWFTSDTHFGHTNILEFEKKARPFKTIEEMNEVLINRWNEVVKPHDIIFHLGDFCFGKHNLRIGERLQGKKKLIMGNHDRYPSADYLLYFEKLYGVTYWERCILSHMPVHANQLGARWWMNIHGHLHSKNIKLFGLKEHAEFFGLELKNDHDPNYFNVSVEQHNLYPVNADIIRAKIKEI